MSDTTNLKRFFHLDDINRSADVQILDPKGGEPIRWPIDGVHYDLDNGLSIIRGTLTHQLLEILDHTVSARSKDGTVSVHQPNGQILLFQAATSS